jgi:hypothetical protein
MTSCVAEDHIMTSLSLSSDAVTVLGLAGTALPFAQSVDDEIERWLRPLRLYGESGRALQALGVGEVPPPSSEHASPKASETSPAETLHIVTVTAAEIASERGVSSVGTQDILIAVMRHYGDDFETVLQARSTDGAELMDRLLGRAGTAAC